jgi:hypothetical protein
MLQTLSHTFLCRLLGVNCHVITENDLFFLTKKKKNCVCFLKKHSFMFIKKTEVRSHNKEHKIFIGFLALLT